MIMKPCARQWWTFSVLTAAGALATIWMVLGACAGATAESRGDSAKVTRTVEVSETIPFTTHEVRSSELRVGTSKTVRAGVSGRKVVTYEVTYAGDSEVSRRVVSTRVIQEPKPEVIYVGVATGENSRGRYAARGYFSGRRVVTMVATGYDPNPASNGGSNRTSTGIKVGYGVAAVDPKFIPIGTKLYIEGYGYAVAADVGGAIKGNRIDLGHDSARGARNVGRRTVRVHILN